MSQTVVVQQREAFLRWNKIADKVIVLLCCLCVVLSFRVGLGGAILALVLLPFAIFGDAEVMAFRFFGFVRAIKGLAIAAGVALLALYVWVAFLPASPHR